MLASLDLIMNYMSYYGIGEVLLSKSRVHLATSDSPGWVGSTDPSNEQQQWEASEGSTPARLAHIHRHAPRAHCPGQPSVRVRTDF